MNRYTRKPTRAFSLIELMIAIVILAVLAAVVIPRFVDHGRRGREAGLKHDLSQMRTVIATYQADTGYYPKLLTDLSATAAPSQGYDSTGALCTIAPQNWHGPYIGSVPNDPISGIPFSYTVTAPNIGNVAASATGNDLLGVAFSTY